MNMRNKKRLALFIWKYLNEKHQKTYIKNKRGRPIKYENKLIIFALLVKTLFRLSFRDTEDFLLELFPNQPIPDFSTLFYRFKNMDKEIIENLIQELAYEIKYRLEAKEFYCIIADGTGFGYAETYNLKYKRGEEIRQVKLHIKTEVLMGIVRGKRVILGVKTGEAYTCERKLLKEMIKDIKIEGIYFLGDSYYGMEVE
ncbi:transposase, partial [Nocardia mangyaensis]|uniref:transposase n=1 Tax=Nocardia mangyaensis TaxID=2213200 RepID=UPI002674E4C3